MVPLNLVIELSHTVIQLTLALYFLQGGRPRVGEKNRFFNKERSAFWGNQCLPICSFSFALRKTKIKILWPTLFHVFLKLVNEISKFVLQFLNL